VVDIVLWTKEATEKVVKIESRAVSKSRKWGRERLSMQNVEAGGKMSKGGVDEWGSSPYHTMKPPFKICEHQKLIMRL
jgi:hypothetical protein